MSKCETLFFDLWIRFSSCSMSQADRRRCCPSSQMEFEGETKHVQSVRLNGSVGCKHSAHVSIMIHVVFIYRPPYSKEHKVTVKIPEFSRSEFGALVEDPLISNGYLLILGDFKSHVQCRSEAFKIGKGYESTDFTDSIKRTNSAKFSNRNPPHFED